MTFHFTRDGKNLTLHHHSGNSMEVPADELVHLHQTVGQALDHQITEKKLDTQSSVAEDDTKKA